MQAHDGFACPRVGDEQFRDLLESHPVAVDFEGRRRGFHEPRVDERTCVDQDIRFRDEESPFTVMRSGSPGPAPTK